MSGVGDSRSELLSWLNELLQLNIKKIEECGTGAAYCQIMDSIYGDLPMHRVKFNASAGYEMQTNFKILQSCFTKHHIEKTIYVEKLTNCKFQDNLEFLQWIKKFWHSNKDESPYDALTRRKNKVLVTNISTSTPGVAKRKIGNYGTSIQTGNNLSNNNGNFNNSSIRSSSYGSSRKSSSEKLIAVQAELSSSQNKITALNKEIETYKDAMEIMEKERDFYFGKLRDIEILVQSTQDLINEGVYNVSNNVENNNELGKFLGKVQHILYATEEGFEVRNGENNGTNGGANSQSTEMGVNDQNNGARTVPQPNLIIDEETF